MSEKTDLTFKQAEHAGWQAKAGTYGAFAGPVTSGAAGPLLDAAKVGADMRVLDVASGPGYGAGEAAARGARATGLDFAPAMVTEARKNFPDAEYIEGDGEDLPFDDESFDAVICPFGILHMPEPDKAIAEAFRVLRPGGRYAFTVWATPEKHEFFALVMGAIQEHGDMDVPLPPAPPIFRFSDPDESRAALEAAGFTGAEVREIPLTWRISAAQDVLDMIYNSTVRTVMMLDAQAPEARERIHAAILESAEKYRAGGGYEMAWPAVLSAAQKP